MNSNESFLRKIKSSLKVVFLLCLMLGLSGCIFLRLSRYLVQMKDPEIYLKYDLTQTPFVAELLEPVVFLSDIETLLKKKANVGEGNIRDFVFEKGGKVDRKPWAFRVWVDKKKRIVQFQLPHRFSTILGNDFIVEGMRSVGYAEVSIRKKRVYLEIGALISKAQMLELMGEPKSQAGDQMSYVFDEDKTPMNIEMTLENDLIQLVLLESNGYSLEATFSDNLKRD
jgi:hypothetical protein